MKIPLFYCLMITKELIQQVAGPFIQEKGLFWVDLRIDHAQNIFLDLDSPKGITIAECAEVNKWLESQIDREVYDYSITVSSPGVGSIFKVKEQYLKNIGKKIEVLLKTGLKEAGVLKEYTDGQITLEVNFTEREGKKKVLKTTTKIIALTEVKESKKIISFK